MRRIPHLFETLCARYVPRVRNVSFGVLLVGAVLSALYLFEGVVAPSSTETAEAWHCVSMTASPAEIVAGESSTLSWRFEEDSGVTVTVDHIPDRVWDGTSGSVSVEPSTTTTYVATAHKSGTSATYSCTVTVTVIPVPEPPITPPACPFTADAYTTIITFANKKLVSDRTLDDALASSNVSLAPGTYTVRSASWDGYPARVDHIQPHEQWYLEFFAGSVRVATTSATTDLRDYVEEDMKIDTLSTALTLSTTADKVTAHHNAFGDTTCCNDVVPICVAVTKHDEPNDPWCSVTLAPTTITRGATSTLSWDSRDMVRAVFDQGIGSVATTGSMSMSPATTTRYTGTFTDRVGGTHTCAATLTVTDATGPTCTMSVSPTSVVGSGDVTLTWAGTRATSASIDQGVGTVPLTGTRTLTVSSSVTYTGTFTAEDGRTAVCTAHVSRTTGGGSCLNCDDTHRKTTTKKTTDPSPSIVLSRTIKNMGGHITLDQIPYTGFEAGPLLTFVFWLGVLGASVFIAYLITITRPMRRLYGFIYATVDNRTDHALYHRASVAVDADGVGDNAVQSERLPLRVMDDARVDAGVSGRTDDGMGVIEETAHRENILLSPEAARRIMAAVTNSTTPTSEFLADLFARVKDTYTREDGWILLSHERAQAMIARMSSGVKKSVPASSRNGTAGLRDTSMGASSPAVSTRSPQSNVSGMSPTHPPQRNTSIAPTASVPPVAAVSDTTHIPTAVPAVTRPIAHTGVSAAERTVQGEGTAVIRRFVENVANGKRQDAYELLRVLSAQGVSLDAFITSVVRKLDAVYRHRIEGNHDPDRELAATTALWSNTDFEVVLGVLVECTDYSYSNGRVGAKVALAKLFDHFGEMKGNGAQV